MIARSVGPSGSPCLHVLGMRVDHVDFDAAAKLIANWAANAPARGRIVCAANVHMTMEAHDDHAFQKIVSDADLVVPDGVPIVWAQRALGLPQRRRVRVTPDLLLELFARFEARGIILGLYGGTPQSLRTFTEFLADAAPRLEVAYAWSPPFRPLTASEDRDVVERVRSAGVQLLLVGLGCPKQEKWMHAHAEQLPCVMFGVGAAFDLFGGRTREAPRWTRDIGLEWAYRLVQQPRRLWRRHALHDPRFIGLLAWQVVSRLRDRRSSRST